LKDNKNYLNIISEIYQEESNEEIEKNNFNSALNKIDKSLEISPNNANAINERAYINTKTGKYDEAIKNINTAINIEPENTIFKNNKLEIIKQKFKKLPNNLLNNEEKEYLEKNIMNNNDINIMQNSVDISLELTKNKIMKLTQEKMKDIINNNILQIKKKKNEFEVKDKINLISSTSELILENIKKNNVNKLDKSLKDKIEQCLDVNEKDTKNNILTVYSHIKNLEKKEMLKPLEIINNNLKYEFNNQQISKNIDVIDNFISQDQTLDVKQELINNLLEYIPNNDFTKYTEADREKDEISDSKKPLFQYFKDKTKEGIAKQLKQTLDEYSYDESLSNQIKGQINKYIDIDNYILKDSQKSKKETSNKIFNCIQTIAKIKKGLTAQNLEVAGNILEKIQDNNNISYTYKSFIKEKIIDTVNISLSQKKDLKVPNNLLNNLSKEAITNVSKSKNILSILDKISDNQNVTEEVQDNLINILRDKSKSIKKKINIDTTNYELAYKILNKGLNILSESQKKITDLTKNTILINKEKNQEKIIKSLNCISSIVNEGFSINKLNEKTLLDLVHNNKNNEKYIEETSKVISNMAKNSMDISNEISGYVVNKIDEIKDKPKLSKKTFIELLACLVNIVDNCDIPKNSLEAFQNCLKDFKNKDKKAELKLAITGLSILSKKHYSLNKGAINSCLDIIESNILEGNSLEELSNIIDKIFKETEIDNNTFTKLLLIMIKNKDLLEKLSLCLLNSLKFKKKEEIESIITSNLKNFEKIIINHLLNDNIINIIKELDFDFYKTRSQIIYEFYSFDLFYSKNIFNNNNFKSCLNFINKYGIINAKYLAVLLRNLNSLEVLNILENTLEKNTNYLNQGVYDNLLKIRTDSSLFSKVLFLIKKFSNTFLTKETIDILIEKSQTNQKEIFEPIIEIIKIFYKNNNKISEISLKNQEIFEIEVKEEKNYDYLSLINKLINKSNFIPDRYFYKIYKMMKNEVKLYNFGFNNLLLALNKNLFVPNDIIDKILENKENEINKKLVQILLIKESYKEIYSNKLLNSLEKNSNKININIINNLQSLIDFEKLENCIKDFVLQKANLINTFTEYKLLYFWIIQDESYYKNIEKIINKSKFSDKLKDIYKLKKKEEKINALLNEGILEDKIKLLSEEDNNQLNLLNKSIYNFKEKIFAGKENKMKLIKLIDFFISQKIKFELTSIQIIQCFDKYLFSDNYHLYEQKKFEKINDNIYKLCRQNWIKLKILDNNPKYPADKINIIIDNFYLYNFEDSLIENIIHLPIFSKYDNIIQIFDYLKENTKYLIEIKNILNSLNKNDTLESFKNKTILIFSEKIISKYNLSLKLKSFYILITDCLLKLNWKLYQVEELISKEIKIDNTIDETYFKNIIIPIIEKNKILYNSKNNKNENLIQILTRYESKYWEYLIKKLAQEHNYGNINENSLDNLISELQEKNKEIPKELSEKIKNIILKIRFIYNSKIETTDGLSKLPINLFEKENIQKWSKSQRTLTLINNEEFLPEALAIIDRTNVLNEGYHIRDVQFISILLIILSPKNKGVFAQIKTGEGKSTIVSVIAVIKALQNTYVDILSSSIVLAQRDKEEKKSFYEYFNLTVGSSDDDDANISLYKKNIVYGDALMFEGDILEVEFSKDPNSKRAKNPDRGFRCIIIDEVDSMCIDNLGSSTRLSSSFPSYEYLKILYPLIYNSLNIIDDHMDNGYYGKELNEEKRKEIVVENLIKVTKELLDKNKKSEERFILPKNLKKYIENQIPYWSNSAYDAKHYYKENYHYIIAKDKLDEPFKNTLERSGHIPKENYTIAPVDFSNTGVVELKSSWSDGLSQFLQIKHGLKLQAENITTTFISHYSFFIRYINSKNNNIYGVTGTIGSDKSKYVLKTLFHVNIFIIPPFRPNKLILLNDKAEFSTKEAWQNEILNNIELNAIELSRTVLVICLTIEESNDLYDFLIKKNYKKNKLFKYQTNNDKLNKGKYEKGDVIIATNLAGRGTDIKLSEEVENNGGMHVIITFLPSNQRVEEQAVGRTARSGAKGSSIIIVNDTRKMEDIKKLRNDREEKRMENIIENNINRIKLKDELFGNFSNLYHEVQNKLINNNLLTLNSQVYTFYKNVKFTKEFSILDDLEENWGLWLKEMKIDDFDNNKSGNEIKNAYLNFENKIKKNFITDNINNILLSNPFNYFSGKRFNIASEKDSELCIFSNYLKDMTNIVDKTESISKKTSRTLGDTISSLKDILCPQIQSIIIPANNIKNTNKLNSSIINEMSEDADNKIKVIEQLINEIQMNKNAIEHHLNNKNSKIILHTCEISELTKDIYIENYFKDIGIPYFYKLDLEEKKNWFGIISIMIIGIFEIGIGILSTYYMFNDFGFIDQGLTDIKYGIDCLLGKEKFDWKEVGKKKLAFAIGLAVNASVGFIRCNLKIPFKKPQNAKNIKETFNIIGKKVGKKLAKEGVNIGIQISMDAFGKEFIITIITKFKEYSKSISVSFFQKKIKEFILNKYGEAFEQMLTIEVVSGNNDWTRILTEQLKVGCRALTKLTKIIVKQLITLIKLLINKKDDWKNLLISTFKNCSWEGIDIFKNSLNESLEHLKLGFLNVFKKFVEKKYCLMMLKMEY